MGEFEVSVRVNSMYVAYDVTLEDLFSHDAEKAEQVVADYRERILQFKVRGKQPFLRTEDTAGGIEVTLRHGVSIEMIARLAEELRQLFKQVIDDQLG